MSDTSSEVSRPGSEPQQEFIAEVERVATRLQQIQVRHGTVAPERTLVQDRDQWDFSQPTANYKPRGGKHYEKVGLLNVHSFTFSDRMWRADRVKATRHRGRCSRFRARVQDYRGRNECRCSGGKTGGPEKNRKRTG